MKQAIFSLLSDSAQVVSGEELSQTLGVSRVAVWKHIQQMQSAGCVIEATPKGYRLVEKPESPWPWVFGRRAGKIHYHPQVESTMSEALALARAGCNDFSVIVADNQTCGRGRLQRVWQSALGGLYFTLILRPDIAPADAPLLNLAAAIDLADILIEHYEIDARLKWPNDILVDGSKIAGILSQMEAEPDRVDFVNLGIGINVNNRPAAFQSQVVSMAQLNGHTVSRIELLSLFLDRFEDRVHQGRWQDVVPQWKQRSITLGRQVQVQTIQEQWTGLAVDLETNGGLIIQTPEGRLKTIFYGDCFHNK